MSITRRSRRTVAAGAAAALAVSTLAVTAVSLAPAAVAAQPKPNHTALVPQKPRADTPRISNGEIFDIEVVGNRVFVAGSFTSIADVSGNTTPVNQAWLAAYDINTGKLDRTFRPTFNGSVAAVEASPDGTKLFVGGTFSSISGVARQKVASLNVSTGVPVAGFSTTASTNNQVTALAATNSTLYVGGRFSRINGQLRTGLAALNATTGAVDMGFDNQISGGIGVNGALTVQQLKLTHDDGKLLVLHTGRKIDGEDRLGIGLIDTDTKQLLPWRTRLWDDNLAIVGGVQRLYAADIAPNDQYFVVGSGSGGDRPPISDTAVAYPIAGGDFTEPLWISRAFDSIYSIAITEQAVYFGGHFNWNESPTADQPWPGLDNVGYGWGQGLSGYALGDQVVRREHIGALNPVDGTALEWNPMSTSFEGNKAMEATPRGLFVGGDGMFQGGVRTGRVAFYDFNSVPAASSTDTTITTPIEGRVVTSGVAFDITGTARNPVGINRVQVQIQDRDSKQYLQDNLTSWGANNSINATLGAGTTNRQWSLPMTLTGTRNLQVMAKTFGSNGTNDSTKAVKKFEVFSFDNQTPTTSVNGPSGVQTSTTFTVSGTAQDDKGVNRINLWFRDEDQDYLQNDGSAAPIFNTFSTTPDVVGATNATWSYEVTLPHEGVWRVSATAVDTDGEPDLRGGTRDIRVDSNSVAPSVTISQPVTMTPPFSVPAVNLTPGGQLTFSGTASDDDALKSVEVSLRNTTTRQNLGSDGTWGTGIAAGNYRISPQSLNSTSYNWSYTTPFVLTPGSYSFTVRATDVDDVTTSSTNQGRLTLNVQVPGDAPPDGLLTGASTTTVTVTNPVLPLAGTATDDVGVGSVEVLVFDNDTGRYLQDNNTMTSGYNTVTASLGTPGGTTTTWSRPVTLPTKGDYSVTVFAIDTVGQYDSSTTGATARYRYYPNDLPPTFLATLGQPVDNTTFDQGRIVVTGRAEDDVAIARVEVGIVNSLGQYMSSSGSFTSTTPSWRTAFLNSPGSTGSNFSYTTPVIPAGTYSVLVRPTDEVGNIGETRTSVNIVVTLPPNNPPVASATFSCTANVCSFDGRGSTDENAPALTYSWTLLNGTTTVATFSGPVPVRTFTSAANYTVNLVVRDEWGAASAPVSLAVPITEPVGNAAPTPTFSVNCIALACSTTSAGTLDPNVGDTITYTWAWGETAVPATSTGATSSRTYLATGSYTITMTATDGWGRSASTTRTVTLVEPGSNTAPSAAFNPTCVNRTCTMNNTSIDPQGDAIRYSWSFGQSPTPTTSTSSQPQVVYTAAGTYTITLTVTDGWNRASTTTRTVTVT